MAPTSRAPNLDFQRPLVTVDVIIFTVGGDGLQVLLVQRPQQPEEPFPGRWALPGGFVDVEQDRTLVACARRKLREKTGVATPYLEQLGSWGGATRDPRGWSATHAYFALIQAPAVKETAETTPQQWEPVEQALQRKLAFDHGEILSAAVQRLRSR